MAGETGNLELLLVMYLLPLQSGKEGDGSVVTQTIFIESLSEVLFFSAFSQEENVILQPLYWC